MSIRNIETNYAVSSCISAVGEQVQLQPQQNALQFAGDKEVH
jgi:hypothetical protein